MLLSIIIPVYNAARYLPECIKSVKRQIYNNYECILIDDGSTDDSYQICKDVALEDLRFRVFQQENSGASVARNKGLLYAKGDYVVFIDADDYVTESYLSDLVSDLDDKTDLVIHGMMRVTNNGDCIDRGMHIDARYNLLLDYNAFFDAINVERYGGPYCKLFRTEVIKSNDIVFNKEILLAEDLDFLLRFLVYCNGIKVSSKNNYIYREVDGSASAHLYEFETELLGLQHLGGSWKNLIKKYPNKQLYNIYGSSIAYLVYRCIFSIYKGKNLLPALDRINSYKRIDKEYRKLYKRYRKPQTLLLKLVKRLFDYNLFRTLDLLMYTICR